MALVVKLDRFKFLKCNGEKMARCEFRGVSKFSPLLIEEGELLYACHVFEFDVIEELSAGEVLTLQLMNKSLWGTVRTVGCYRLGLHIPVLDGHIAIIDTLVDECNRAVPIYVEMEVYYFRPEEDISSRIAEIKSMQISPRKKRLPAIHGRVSSTWQALALKKGLPPIPRHIPMQSLPQAPLLSLSQVPAQSLSHVPVQSLSHVPVQSLPQVPVQSLSHVPAQRLAQVPAHGPVYAPVQVPMHVPVHGSRLSSARGSVSSNQARSQSSLPSDSASALQDVQRNITTLEHSLNKRETVVDIESDDESRARKLKIAGKRILSRGQSAATDQEPSTSKGARKREYTLKSVRNILRLARGRNRNDSDDEEQCLLDRPGPSSAPDRVLTPTSISSDEEVRPPPKIKRKKSTIDTAGPSALKASDFQICVTVIEARQLAGCNVDPVVCVQIGDEKKYTSTKESTNCPYYNEYFVFDFNLPPIMLLDKIITLSVYHSRTFPRTNQLLGTFKLDVATVWTQPDKQFYHKWALLTDPENITAGPKGYLKCDIIVNGKGDNIKIPPKSNRDGDDIEANLLMPVGLPFERQRARYFVKIYRADGLPQMNYSFLANMKRTFTGETRDLVDPFVSVTYAGLHGKTSVKKNSYAPVWDEQIIFTEMFPPLCQRIKIELRDYDPVHKNIIGTHYIDMRNISHDGYRGFLPTFGPSYIYLYGSSRDYSLLDQYTNLNKGVGEGIYYRARMLISIRVELVDNLEYPMSRVDVEKVTPITDTFEKKQEYFLFASVFEANMIDKKLAGCPLHFEISIGNAGNSIDGHYDSLKRSSDMDSLDLDVTNPDLGYWQSTTYPMRVSDTEDRTYYSMPICKDKQCMHVRCIWPDSRYRLYNKNLISDIIDLFEEGLVEVQSALEETDEEEEVSDMIFAELTSLLDSVSTACAVYVARMSNAPPFGNTKLDREWQKLCFYEIKQLTIETRTLKTLVTKNTFRERMRTASTYLERLKHLCEDAQHSMPDIFIWMIHDKTRIAYCRFKAKDIIFSERPGESGKFCGRLQTVFLNWPIKKPEKTVSSNWVIPAKISVYVWLGILQDKQHFIDGLPPGYKMCAELRNADMPRINPPSYISYEEHHYFQVRAYIYQARSLIGSDSSGLSDPFARVIIGKCTATTQVIDETLNPTWDEGLIIPEILLYSTLRYIKSNPPKIVIEIFDQDTVGKSEFLGRAVARPHVKTIEDIINRKHVPPSLEWYEITRGENMAGELLAAFEILEISEAKDLSYMPELPPVKDFCTDPRVDPIYAIPDVIRPTLSRYRIEVLFWGLRDMKRLQFGSIDEPRVDIECCGNVIKSSTIQNAKRNANFNNPVQFIDVELPDQDLYRPPLTIRVLDCRPFGRTVIAGSHTINSINKYIYTPKTKREREIEQRKKSLIPLENIDLRSNCVIQDDEYAIEIEKENWPLLNSESPVTPSYGTHRTGAEHKTPLKRDAIRKQELDDHPKDWWTKYFFSYESMAQEENEKKECPDVQQTPQPSTSTSCVELIRSSPDDTSSPRSERNRKKDKQPSTPDAAPPKTEEKEVTARIKIYPHELEAVPEFEEFKEWLQPFELYRGKKTGNEADDENRVVGTFKGALKVYKWPLPNDVDDHTVMGFNPNNGFFQGVPSNEPKPVLVRVYIVKALDLHPMDLNGKADPYIALQIGSRRISDKENYVAKQLNPVFGKCFEFEATLPQDSTLSVQIFDWDLVGSDDLIGETKIDLENRFYSRHRATCGLPDKYELHGYNRWRDAMKPTQILGKLCKDAKLDQPVYGYGRVRIGRVVFNMPITEGTFSNAEIRNNQMALTVLHRWHEFPDIGTRLVTEHVETRSLYNPNKPGIEQGRLEMWVDMFPMDMPQPPPPVDISPRKPKSYEMRVIIWNTDDVVLQDDDFFSGEKMSDIYVKGWLLGPDDSQTTDTHFRSLTGEGNFNWRFIYPFDYLEAEQRIVISRKESVFSWDESQSKIPPRLELQVWDADHLTSDDFLGALTLDLNRFPRGARSSKQCSLELMRTDGTVPLVNLFKQKRIKGWWPFHAKNTNQMELTGKVEAEIHLLTSEEAERAPAGYARSEPDPLEKPNRPDTSFQWILNPLKAFRYIIWRYYKWQIIKYAFIFIVATIFLCMVYAVPGYTVKKFLGA